MLTATLRKSGNTLYRGLRPSIVQKNGQGFREGFNGSSLCRGLSSERKAASGPAGRFWKWTTQERPHWRESMVEAIVLFCVFGVTGSSSMMLVRPALAGLGLKGNMVDGPWTYRILSLLIVSPIYACVLVTVGTLAGRHTYFARMAAKIYGRFLPKSFGINPVCPPAARKIDGPKIK